MQDCNQPERELEKQQSLKSIIVHMFDQFWWLRFGTGRPLNREEVPHYVLENFKESD